MPAYLNVAETFMNSMFTLGDDAYYGDSAFVVTNQDHTNSIGVSFPGTNTIINAIKTPCQYNSHLSHLVSRELFFVSSVGAQESSRNIKENSVSLHAYVAIRNVLKSVINNDIVLQMISYCDEEYPDPKIINLYRLIYKYRQDFFLMVPSRNFVECIGSGVYLEDKGVYYFNTKYYMGENITLTGSIFNMFNEVYGLDDLPIKGGGYTEPIQTSVDDFHYSARLHQIDNFNTFIATVSIHDNTMISLRQACRYITETNKK